MSSHTYPTIHTLDLPTGTLSVQVEQSDLPLEALCGFASRANPKRGFLFVSKVLGKHIPVEPHRMIEIHNRLATQLEAVSRETKGPFLFIALAETATCLGQGIYESWLKFSPPQASLFTHSTRYRLGNRPLLEFQESHSHASDHFLHVPTEPHLEHLFSHARTLVLIDDEMTTGSTFHHLIQAYFTLNPQLERIFLLTLTDWLGMHREQFLSGLPLPTEIVSLLSGSFTWTPNPHFQFQKVPSSESSQTDKTSILKQPHARLGISGTLDWDFDQQKKPFESLLGRPLRILVLGSGEFSYLPMRFAQHLEEAGHEVYFQTTTRSPILLGGAIKHKMELADNYFDGIPNYVYNLCPEHYDTIFIGYETSKLPTEHQSWLRHLGAREVFFT